MSLLLLLKLWFPVESFLMSLLYSCHFVTVLCCCCCCSFVCSLFCFALDVSCSVRGVGVLAVVATAVVIVVPCVSCVLLVLLKRLSAGIRCCVTAVMSVVFTAMRYQTQ